METKECTKCHIVKSLDEFHRARGKKTGHVSHCKTCRAEYKKRYDDARREEKNAKNREYYKNNKDKIREYYHTDHSHKVRNAWHKEYRKRPEVKERLSRNLNAFYRRVWQEAFQFFGPCECCGESELEFLSIDHRNGNGKEERSRGISGIQILERLRREGWPEEAKKEYRLLCYNCNFTIGHYGYCPHHPEVKYPYYYDKRNRKYTDNVDHTGLPPAKQQQRGRR